MEKNVKLDQVEFNEGPLNEVSSFCMEAHKVCNVSKFDGFAEVLVIKQRAEEKLVMFDITLCLLEGILRLRAIRMLECVHL